MRQARFRFPRGSEIGYRTLRGRDHGSLADVTQAKLDAVHDSSMNGHARRWATKHLQNDIDKLLRRSVESKAEKMPDIHPAEDQISSPATAYRTKFISDT